jgi:hypothetical protein
VDSNAKQFMLDTLRKEFMSFMGVVAKMPGALAQKQQAFYRFDEGHMWMQNAVAAYVPEKEAQAAPAPEVADLVPEPALPTMDVLPEQEPEAAPVEKEQPSAE